MHVVVMRSVIDLRVQATKCRNPRAAAILTSVAGWLEGKSATDGNLEPHEFADLWTEDGCVKGCRLRNAVREFMENTTPTY